MCCSRPNASAELEQLVVQLKEFRPTKVALEVDERFEPEINANYQGYLKGAYELQRGEWGPDWLSVSKTDGTSEVVRC